MIILILLMILFSSSEKFGLQLHDSDEMSVCTEFPSILFHSEAKLNSKYSNAVECAANCS